MLINLSLNERIKVNKLNKFPMARQSHIETVKTPIGGAYDKNTINEKNSPARVNQ